MTGSAPYDEPRVMPWIQSHTEVERHRKTLMMAQDLNIAPVHLSGHLHALWHAVLEQREDGNLAQWSNEFIALMAMWQGDADRFVSALKRFHWLDDNGLVHNWLDYAGSYLRSKYHSS